MQPPDRPPWLPPEAQGPPAPPGPPEQAPPPPAYPEPPAYPPPAYPPAPDQPPPPGGPYYGQPGGPPPAPPRRGRGPLLAIVVAIVVLIVLVGGYAVAGFAVANSESSSARNTYNTVTDRQNSLIELFNKLTGQINTSVDVNNPTKATVDSVKTLYQQLVTQSQAAQPQVQSDDASLADADAKLKQNQWLTALRRSSLDQLSKKIEYRRDALAAANTTLGDYIRYGNFVVAFMGALDDVITLTDSASAHDLVGAASAVTALKSDLTKTTALDHAPGLPSDVDAYLHDFQTLAGDFSNLFNAAASGDQAAVTNAENAITADGKKLDSHDTSAWDSQVTSFFQQLIDQYNTANAQANNA